MANKAPAPNKAPIPTAPVTIGTAPAELLRVEEEAAGPPPTDAVGVATPEVNGASETLEAPEKAGAPELAVGEAEDVELGFRTLFVVRTNDSQ